ncbi:MAG: helix-turn-helix transcriptional regulator [Oscillibacter sp.]
MYEIDNQKFGSFLTQLRKQRGLTQKALGEQLHITDKAVSKWERGLSMPDIALLSPLSDLLDVSVTELLRGEHLDASGRVEMREVENLVAGTIALSAREQEAGARRRQRGRIYFACAAIAALEILLLLALGFTTVELAKSVFLVEGLCLRVGGWPACLSRTRCPITMIKTKLTLTAMAFFA